MEILQDVVKVAMKSHRCCLCGCNIKPGQMYASQRCVEDGEFWEAKSHCECRTLASYLDMFDSIRSIYRTGIQDCVVLNDKECSDGVIAFVDKLTPIPITAEMLERNGFVDKGSRLFPYEREWRGDKSAVNICSFDEELWFADFEFRDGPTCMSDIPLIYINQLQHILRLAGVDKEINL